MNREAARNNRPFTHAKAARNLSKLPRGYGWLYGLNVLHGQVCNGGFEQFYENTSGWPTSFAISALREIGQDSMAQLVDESLASALLYCPEMVKEGVNRPKSTKVTDPRSFEELDAAYFALDKQMEPEWLDAAMISLLLTLEHDF
jgi:hypothetical protein